MRRSGFSAALALLLVAGCAHERGADEHSRPSEAHYAHLFGQRYRTQADLYLFTFGDPDYQYLSDARFGPKELPAPVSRENIGQVYKHWAEDGLGDVKILDVIPAGSGLTIAAETHEVTPLSGVRGSGGYPMGFICALEYNGKKVAGVLTEFIQSHKEVAGKVPNQEINPAAATKIEP
jgi:hypothetical protein